MVRRPRYIYFAGDNLIGTPYYRKAVIIGETQDLQHRQYMYSSGKGMMMPRTGTLISYLGQKGLPWPFIDYFLAPPGVSDTYVHELFRRVRPFKDFVYPIMDKRNMHTKEAFGLVAPVSLEEAVAQLKRLLLEYLGG